MRFFVVSSDWLLVSYVDSVYTGHAVMLWYYWQGFR